MKAFGPQFDWGREKKSEEGKRKRTGKGKRKREGGKEKREGNGGVAAARVFFCSFPVFHQSTIATTHLFVYGGTSMEYGKGFFLPSDRFFLVSGFSVLGIITASRRSVGFRPLRHSQYLGHLVLGCL